MRSIALIILSLIINFSSAIAAEIPVAVTLTQQHETGKVILNFDITPGWYVYGENPGELGLPLKITSPNSYITVDLPPTAIKTEKINGDLVSTKVYFNSFNATVDYDENSYEDIQLEIEYGACKDICIKFDNSFKIKGKGYPVSIIASMIGFAILGGFLLNLMPCVLPVLALKLIGFVRYSHLPRLKVRKHLLTCSLGICGSFIALGLLTSVLKASGDFLGWGFHFQNPIFITFVAVVLILFASYLWDEKQLNIPNFIQNIGTNNSSYIGSFLTGAFATLLATPCTVPFLGSSVAFALSQNFAMIFIIYLSIGIGMSTPYLLVAANSNFIKLLPRPGKWMVYTKKTFSILLLLSAFWFLYVLMAHYTLNTFLIILGTILLVKFALTSIKSTKWSLAIASFIFISLLNSLPSIESKFEIEDAIYDKMWQPFNTQQLNAYVDNGNVIFVDVTAEWCLGCKLNKIAILNRPDIEYYFKEHNIILMRADLTRSQIDPKILSFLSAHGREGIPLNVMYGPKNKKGLVLPVVLSKSDIIDGYAAVTHNQRND